MIELKELCCGYGKKEVVSGVNEKIEGGSIDEFCSEAVPEGVAPLVSGTDRFKVLPCGGVVDLFVVEHAVAGRRVDIAASVYEQAAREKNEGKFQHGVPVHDRFGLLPI